MFRSRTNAPRHVSSDVHGYTAAHGEPSYNDFLWLRAACHHGPDSFVKCFESSPAHIPPQITEKAVYEVSIAEHRERDIPPVWPFGADPKILDCLVWMAALERKGDAVFGAHHHPSAGPVDASV